MQLNYRKFRKKRLLMSKKPLSYGIKCLVQIIYNELMFIKEKKIPSKR